MTGALECTDVRSAIGQAQCAYTFGVNGTVIDFVDHEEIYLSFYFYNNPGIPKSGSTDKYGVFERFTVLCWWF